MPSLLLLWITTETLPYMQGIPFFVSIASIQGIYSSQALTLVSKIRLFLSGDFRGYTNTLIKDGSRMFSCGMLCVSS